MVTMEVWLKVVFGWTLSFLIVSTDAWASDHIVFHQKIPSRNWVKENSGSHLVFVQNGTTPNSGSSCSSYQKLQAQGQCDFVHTNPDCHVDEGFINYIEFIVCKFEPRLRPIGLLFLAIWLLFLLIGLGITADDFFCPALTVISSTLRLSQNIAGVTFLAFGNGAPDIFSAVAAISTAKNGDAGLAIGALFGAGIFVTTIVAGAIALVHPFTMVQRPFLRDVIFYLAAVFWTWYILYRGKIYLLEAIGFIGLYFLYVMTVLVGRKIYQSRKKKQQRRQENGTGPLLAGESSPMAKEEPFLGNARSVYDLPSNFHSVNAPYIEEHHPHPVAHNNLIHGLGAPEQLAVAVVLHAGVPPEAHSNPSPDGSALADLMRGHVGIGDDDQEHIHPVKEFLIGLSPIDTEWKKKSFLAKIYDIFKSPVVFLLNATVPVVDYEEEKHHWNKLLTCLQCITAPLFCVMVTNVGIQSISGAFQVWHLAVIIGFLCSVFVFFTSKYNKHPVYHWVFAYFGFVVAVLWIYSIANEIVNLLQMYGDVFQISNAILGLTVLAWGNSIGDLIADTAMAKQGFPTMALSACFGGPLFNMLVGIGLSCTIACVAHGGSFKLNRTGVQDILAAGLAISLIFSLFFMLIRWFKINKSYSILLVVIYVAFLVLALLSETGIF